MEHIDTAIDERETNDISANQMVSVIQEGIEEHTKQMQVVITVGNVPGKRDHWDGEGDKDGMNQMAQTLQLQDGRTLGYAEFGAPEGKPIFYCTGGQSSRLDGRQFTEVARDLGVRLVTMDRPGMGLSDHLPDRRFLDWPDDVRALADHLGIDTFSIFGLSGGGPHALATAYKIPDRIDKVGIVCGAAPITMPNRSKGLWFPIRVMYFLAKYLPWMHRKALSFQAKSIQNKEKFLKQMQMGLPAPDRTLFEHSPEVGIQFLEAGIEGYRNGIAGDAHEWQLYVSDWGFALDQIQQEVHLWYGEFDGMVPPAMGTYLAAQLPKSQLKIVPDGGHLSTIHNHIEDILRTLSLPNAA